MATESKIKVDLMAGLLFGIGGWFLATILSSTDIFYMVSHLPTIGLFVGLVAGLFKDKLGF